MNNSVKLTSRRYGAVNWLGLQTLLWREIWRFLKVSAQTIVAPLVSTILFMVVFALALGGAPPPIGDVRYADFLAPGLLMMSILTNSFANSSSSLVIAKVQGNAVDFLMPPLSATELAIAFIGGAAARGMLVGLVGAICVAPLANVVPQHWGVVIFYTVVASVMFAAIGLIGGIWADKFDHLAAVQNFIITPLTFLSGTFYSVDRLPHPVSDIAHWNPVFFLIDGFRYGFIGHHDGSVVIGASVSLALAVGLCVWAWFLLKTGYRLKS